MADKMLTPKTPGRAAVWQAPGTDRDAFPVLVFGEPTYHKPSGTMVYRVSYVPERDTKESAEIWALLRFPQYVMVSEIVFP